jgi:hypothetical protein
MAQVDAMRQWAPPVFILALLVAGVAGARALGLGDLIRLLVSLIPRRLQRRGHVAGDLLRAGVMAVLEAPRQRELWHRAPERPTSESGRFRDGEGDHGWSDRRRRGLGR